MSSITFFILNLLISTPQQHITAVPKTTIQLNSITPENLSLKKNKLKISATDYSSKITHSKFIGSVCLSSAYIYVSYPFQNLVARYSFGNEKTLWIGPQIRGGNGVPLDHPGSIAYIKDKLIITSLNTGAVFITDKDGEIKDFDVLRTILNPLPAPAFAKAESTNKRRYLLLDPHSADLLKRLDHRGKVLVRYGFGPTSRSRIRDRLDWDFRGMAHVLPDWSILYAAFSGKTILHFKPDGIIRERFILEASAWQKTSAFPLNPVFEGFPQSQDSVKAVQYVNDVYWILLNQNGRSQFLTIKEQEYRLFNLAESWDGFLIDHSYLCLFQRDSGKVKVFQWP